MSTRAALLGAVVLSGLGAACDGEIGGVAVSDDVGVSPAILSQLTTGTIVPLYTSPRGGTWGEVIAAKRAHPTVPVVAVVNPHNGPGTTIRADYTEGIALLAGAGVHVVGYVRTEYGARAASSIRADIDRWRAHYPEVMGIFFDQQARRSGSEDHYRGLTRYARSVGLRFTVGNPGAIPAETYVGAVDTVLLYESPGLPQTLSLWHTGYPRQNFGIIPYGTSFEPSYVKSMKTDVGFIYLTDGDGPNPWDRLSSYFDDLLAALE